jgi:transcriptional regulator with XRE-family HTH domain
MSNNAPQSKESPLKRRREELGLTQRDIGLALGKTDQTVSNWETGIYEPKMTPREFKKLCEILQWSLKDVPEDFGPPSVTS